MPTPTRPRLKKGETPQSPAFVKRMREFNRQVALAEANAAKAEQDAREASERGERDVLAETRSTGRSRRSTESESESSSDDEPETKKKDRIAESGRSALENRQQQLDSMEEAIESGVQEANADTQARRRKKN